MASEESFLVLVHYKGPIKKKTCSDDVKYDSFVIGSDEDLEVLFHCCRRFPEVGTPKLLAKLVDVVSSSGGSNRNPQAPTTAACSSSGLVVLLHPCL
ncbi:hypothetical protein Ahy_A07g031875 [Arachis hypogaea]|uniref:Uncharacterized protein n=1 Tax=Arachis hypogaea TaxID=3818 RepID=A0A445C588_ARAHY|nr:hypothetical protein Ahy_A07g031875 [Arachis hypogaea]